MKPLAVVSHILPPSPSGQAVMLHRLLQNWDPKDYCLLSLQDYSKGTEGRDSMSKLPAQYYQLKPAFHLRGFQQFTILGLFDLLLQTLHRARSIVRIVKRERCRAVMACSGNLLDLPASYLASRWMHVPFYAYIFDDYVYQWTKRLHRFYARCTERIALRNATAVIVPNKFLGQEYSRRYHVQPTVIHNPCENSQINKRSELPWPSTKEEIKIVYTGAIYHAHFDAFRNLMAALDILGRTDIRLHLYTAQPRAELERENICGPIIYHNHIAPSDLLEVQKRADILFLALAFNSAIPEVIRTSAPGKMGEYMASGRPVLVYAPPDSFATWYFKKYKCGVVVDQSNPAMLRQAIERIIDNVELRKNVVKSARAQAQIDFNLSTAQNKLMKILQTKNVD